VVRSLQPISQLTQLSLALHYPRIGEAPLPALEAAVAALTQLRCIRVLDLPLLPPGDWLAGLQRAVLPLWMYPEGGPSWEPEDLEAAGKLEWLGLVGVDVDGEYEYEPFLLCLLRARPPRLRHLCIDAPVDRFLQVAALAGEVGVQFACTEYVWDAAVEADAEAGVASTGGDAAEAPGAGP